VQVAEEERSQFELIHRCLTIRAITQFPSEAESILQSLCEAAKDIPCAKSKIDLTSEIVDVVSCIARTESIIVRAMCLQILNLHGDVSTDLLYSIADALISDHISDFVIEHFVGVIFLLKIRSLTELCSRSLFRIVEIACRRKPTVLCKCFLSRILLSYESGVTRDPGAAQYELFQRILRQVLFCRCKL
jgi:hypothetical protein